MRGVQLVSEEEEGVLKHSPPPVTFFANLLFALIGVLQTSDFYIFVCRKRHALLIR